MEINQYRYIENGMVLLNLTWRGFSTSFREYLYSLIDAKLLFLYYYSIFNVSGKLKRRLINTSAKAMLKLEKQLDLDFLLAKCLSMWRRKKYSRVKIFFDPLYAHNEFLGIIAALAQLDEKRGITTRVTLKLGTPSVLVLSISSGRWMMLIFEFKILFFIGGKGMWCGLHRYGWYYMPVSVHILIVMITRFHLKIDLS